jgi:hypothetical protein
MEDRQILKVDFNIWSNKKKHEMYTIKNFYYSLILEILLNFIVFGLLLYVLVLMWLKKEWWQCSIF